MRESLTINIGRVRDEAKRLNEYRSLLIEFTSPIVAESPTTKIVGRVLGFAIDSEGRDCLIVNTVESTKIATHLQRRVNRCIPASKIRSITVLVGKSTKASTIKKMFTLN